MAGSLELTLLDRLNGLGVAAAGGRQRTDSTHVLGRIRSLGRLELAGESVQAALVALAAAASCRTLRVRPEILAPSEVITQQVTHRDARDAGVGRDQRTLHLTGVPPYVAPGSVGPR